MYSSSPVLEILGNLLLKQVDMKHPFRTTAINVRHTFDFSRGFHQIIFIQVILKDRG